MRQRPRCIIRQIIFLGAFAHDMSRTHPARADMAGLASPWVHAARLRRFRPVGADPSKYRTVVVARCAIRSSPPAGVEARQPHEVRANVESQDEHASGAMVERPEESPQYKLHTHCGVLHLAFHGGMQRWVLRHTLTGEIAWLPPTDSEWCMEMDGGCGLLFDLQPEPQAVAADDILVHRVFSATAGDDFLVENTAQDGNFQVRSLHDARSDHNYGVCVLSMGAGLAKDRLPFAQFVLPRDSNHIYWNISAVAGVIQVAPGGTASFVQKYIAAWNRTLSMLGVAECLRSQQYEKQRHECEDRARVLKFITCSSTGLVALLTKWCFLRPNRGGLRNSDAARAGVARLVVLVRRRRWGGVYDVHDRCWQPERVRRHAARAVRHHHRLRRRLQARPLGIASLRQRRTTTCGRLD